MPSRVSLQEYMNRSPLHRWLGCEITAFHDANGEVVVGLPFRSELSGDPDGKAAHGGIVATLVDLAAHAAIHAKLGTGAPTIDIKVDYLRPAVLPLTARAIPRRVGRTIAFADVDVFDESGKLAAVGRAVFATGRGT